MIKKFYDKKGKEIKVDPKGSLSLLAFGYQGLMAWRTAKKGKDRDHLIRINPPENSKSDEKK